MREGHPPQRRDSGRVSFSRSNTRRRMGADSRIPVPLPVGYRLVAVASDAWVLLAPGGIRVARYLGSLDRWRVELDAREHQGREQ